MSAHQKLTPQSAQDVTATHTPGPWICEHGADDFFFVAPADGEFDHDQRNANARLIAAAPDVLAALQDMLSGWRYVRAEHGDLYGVGWDRAEEIATAAIAKATAA